MEFFATYAEWRHWLEEHHQEEQEVLVHFFKKGCGKASITWPEAVDGALCFGWIDGVRKNIDAESYSIRFTPRRARSIWSAVNIRRAGELIEQGLMQPAGLKMFAAREEKRSGIYSFEQGAVAFDDRQQKQLQANKAAWKFFSTQAKWYQKTATWWVISAKREETREKRLAALIEHSEEGRTLPHLTRNRE